MLGKTTARKQADLFRPLLENFIDHKHELLLLSRKTDWDFLEKEFADWYSSVADIQKIFTYSVQIHGKAAEGKMMLSDTGVQENNTKLIS